MICYLFALDRTSSTGTAETDCNHSAIFVVSDIMQPADDGVCLEKDNCNGQQVTRIKEKDEKSDSAHESSNDEAIGLDNSETDQQEQPASEGYDNFSYDF